MKAIIITIMILFFAISIVVMESGEYIKGMKLDGESIPELLDEAEENINSRNYSAALSNINQIDKYFRKILKFIQFSVERDESNSFAHNLAHLKGHLLSEDYAESLSQVTLLKSYWEHLGE
jgi:hypothetical protein